MENVYIIPFRKAFKKPRTKRADSAIQIIKDFIMRHMKVTEVRIGKHLNEFIWSRGREKIPRRVKVKSFTEEKDGKMIAKIELIGFEYKSLQVKAPVEKKAPEKQKEGAPSENAGEQENAANESRGASEGEETAEKKTEPSSSDNNEKPADDNADEKPSELNQETAGNDEKSEEPKSAEESNEAEKSN